MISWLIQTSNVYEQDIERLVHQFLMLHLRVFHLEQCHIFHPRYCPLVNNWSPLRTDSFYFLQKILSACLGFNDQYS